MTEITSNPTPALVRCAVCKIDFKGRFVYIDDDIEALLGRTKEELFGRPLQEFLDPGDKSVVSQLLSQRNHYETFHEATFLTIIKGDGESVPVRAIASLNFNAGNPVNLQLVLDAAQFETTPETAPTVEPTALPVMEFVSAVLALDGPSEVKPFLELLREFSDAESAALYVVGDGTLEPRAGAFRDQSIEHVFAAIPEPTKLHLEVAANNGEYSFLAQEDVAEAVEQTGLAPAELVTCLTLGCSRYLLVLTFAEQLGPATAQVSLDRAQMGIGLARRVLAGASPDATAALDIQFTVGFLDHLGIGTLLTQSDGTIIGYNRALVTFLGDATPGETPAEFAALLQPHEDDDQLPLLQKCFEHHDQNEERPDFKMTVKLPTDATAQLRVLWLGEQADDLSSAIVLLPVSSDPSPMAPSADAFWTSVAASLRTELLAIADGVQAWSHSAYDVEHQEPSATVRDITAAARAIRSTLSEIDDLANQASDAGTTRLTDLTLILAEVMDEVGAWYPEVEAVCEYEGLPKILTDQDVLRQVLRNLISNSVKFCGKGQAKVNIKVEAIVEDGECRLEISDDGDGIPRAVLGQVFQYGRQADESNSSHPTGAGMSLSLTRKLVRRMGGEMQIESKRGKGVKVSITMPGQSLGDDDEKTADPSDS